jgi:hypothetical protein
MIRYICPGCQTPLESPDSQAGNTAVCPSCGRINEVHEAARQAPEYIRVQLSAQVVQWPQKCVCCCEESDTVMPLAFTKQSRGQTRERYWEAPCCSACLAHVQGIPGATRKRTCCGTGAAVIYDGWHGWVHSFRFRNRDYVRRFVEANAGKVLNCSS